jgi:hypothetical protein
LKVGMAEQMVKLKSSEGVIIECSLKGALMSQLIKGRETMWIFFRFHHLTFSDLYALCDTTNESIESPLEIPVQNVSAPILRKVVEWCDHWKETEQPSSEEIKDKTSETIDSWDKTFLHMELVELYELVSIGNVE